MSCQSEQSEESRRQLQMYRVPSLRSGAHYFTTTLYSQTTFQTSTPIHLIIKYMSLQNKCKPFGRYLLVNPFNVHRIER